MDDADISDEQQRTIDEARIAEAHLKAQQMVKGIPGECEACGDYNPRLVACYNPIEYETQYCCSPCRDKFLKVYNGNS